MEYRFQTLDYVVVAVLLFASAAFGLYVSNVKNKQATLMEYFLAGKNVPTILVLLSYFSTYCSGSMTGQAIEVYSFGSQSLVFILVSLAIIPVVQYLVLPVFYPLQNVSMLKYFDLRFGKAVTNVALISIISGMVLVGSVNIFVSAIIIEQVSAIKFWVAATTITAVCILYSTLGGMRGIIITDAIQAVIIIVPMVAILIIGVIKTGGRNVIWEISNRYDRLELFNFNLDPRVRCTFWSTFIGFGFLTISYSAMNQTLLQRCIMAPNINSANKISKIGILLGIVFILLYQMLGLVIFSYYDGCNIQQTGQIKSLNHLISYFAMEILYDYPTLPGLYFSGLLSAALSTISSLLNSIAALIIVKFKEVNNESRSGTFLCKILVLISGLIMFSIIFLLDNFPNFIQATLTCIAIAYGPIFAIYCISILCPKGNSKCVAISFLMALTFGFYLLAGSLLVKSKDLPKPFANCTFNATAIGPVNANTTMKLVENNIEAYFPLNNVSYLYISLEVFLATVITFIFFSFIIGQKKQNGIEFDLSLIPPCVQKLHLKLSKKWRKWLLCDVYDDNTADITNEEQDMLSKNEESNPNVIN